MNAPIFAKHALRSSRDEELSVFLIAGEPSGDLLGAGLMRALTKRAGRVRFAGVGGPAMEAQGLREPASAKRYFGYGHHAGAAAAAAIAGDNPQGRAMRRSRRRPTSS